MFDPVTPAKDPAAIDRRGLVGVGELATPRWGRHVREHEDLPQNQDQEQEDDDDDESDSPWTIEAVDGEGSERENVRV
jgi:dual specificity tyrosine-phosphorylation-regulated kinase 2/3/4